MADMAAAEADAERDRELEERLRDVGRQFAYLPVATDDLLELLDQTEKYLVNVEQSPSPSMSKAINPILSALVEKELLEHENIDVRVAVAACSSEITRITAPEAPYEDDQMKDVFGRIVEAFENLDDRTSRSYRKRIGMLETVAKVRSCVIMLDLECDDLILEMFSHFFKTVSSEHPDRVFSSMESIMSLIIEESEEISKNLISCLLHSVRKDGSKPKSLELGEKVISNCAEKLKPALVDAVKGVSLSDYSTVLSSLLQENSDNIKKAVADSSGKNMADGSKASDGTVCDESAQESAKSEKDVNSPEENGTSLGDGPTCNGKASTGDHEDTEDREAKAGPEPKLESSAGAQPVGIAQSRSKKSGPKDSSDGSAHENDNLNQEAEIHEDTLADSEEDPPVLPLKRKKRGKAAAAAQSHAPSGKLDKSGGTKDSQKKRQKTVHGTADDDLDSTPTGRPKRGQSSKTSVGKVKNRTSNSETKSAKSVEKSSLASSPEKKKKSLDMEKDENVSDDDASGDLSLKEMVSAKSAKALGKKMGNLEEGGGSKRKRGQEVMSMKKKKCVDEGIVGSRIEVWWPDDERYYSGLVDSYDPSSKKHKIVYDDSEIEILLLGKEKWKFADEETSGDKENELGSPDGGSEKTKVKGKKRLGRPPKVDKSEAISKEESNASEEETPKPRGRGRPKGIANSKTASNKLKGKAAAKDSTESSKSKANMDDSTDSGKADNRSTRSKESAKRSIASKSADDGDSDEATDDDVPPPKAEAPKSTTVPKKGRPPRTFTAKPSEETTDDDSPPTKTEAPKAKKGRPSAAAKSSEEVTDEDSPPPPKAEAPKASASAKTEAPKPKKGRPRAAPKPSEETTDEDIAAPKSETPKPTSTGKKGRPRTRDVEKSADSEAASTKGKGSGPGTAGKRRRRKVNKS